MGIDYPRNFRLLSNKKKRRQKIALLHTCLRIMMTKTNSPRTCLSLYLFKLTRRPIYLTAPTTSGSGSARWEREREKWDEQCTRQTPRELCSALVHSRSLYSNSRDELSRHIHPIHHGIRSRIHYTLYYTFLLVHHAGGWLVPAPASSALYICKRDLHKKPQSTSKDVHFKYKSAKKTSNIRKMQWNPQLGSASGRRMKDEILNFTLREQWACKCKVDCMYYVFSPADVNIKLAWILKYSNLFPFWLQSRSAGDFSTWMEFLWEIMVQSTLL